ncbi:MULTISPECIES: winged helix-turn-helix transcriptional regulator [Rhizobium]|jgi:DNA-binding HxlR family transcriptional regulator|uniref:Transcriptional regulator, HxlR family n=1 Tax=Rhizobium lusitanum TaxID=293958 RepID=A0A1C3WD07_9HYPH|nr:helix-turn-helix domain-containing protein [Rhizobium lusitanum]SCB37843.1 transcriptional regulator, HxlR family [Rhizobium lusitanum]
MTDKGIGLNELAELGPHGQQSCLAHAQILQRLGDKWTILVVGALVAGPVRFNALLRAIHGISHRMLTLTLRGLQRSGVVSRRTYPTTPPKVEYELTPLGHSLVEPLRHIVVWAQHNEQRITAARAIFDHHDGANG